MSDIENENTAGTPADDEPTAVTGAQPTPAGEEPTAAQAPSAAPATPATGVAAATAVTGARWYRQRWAWVTGIVAAGAVLLLGGLAVGAAIGGPDRGFYPDGQGGPGMMWRDDDPGPQDAYGPQSMYGPKGGPWQRDDTRRYDPRSQRGGRACPNCIVPNQNPAPAPGATTEPQSGASLSY